MENIIEIEDLTFNYPDKPIFRNLNIKIKKDKFTTILGANGSGKTTIIKLLQGKLNANTFIMIENTPVIKEDFCLVADDICTLEIGNKNQTVMQLLNSKTKDKTKIKQIIESLNLKETLKHKIKILTKEKQTIVAFASLFLKKPKILLIDGQLNNLNHKEKNTIINLLKSQKHLTIINATSNEEESLYGEEIVIINKTNPALSMATEEMLLEKELLSDYGLKQPFIIQLSEKLQFYNLIDKTYLNQEKLVDDLWK